MWTIRFANKQTQHKTNMRFTLTVLNATNARRTKRISANTYIVTIVFSLLPLRRKNKKNGRRNEDQTPISLKHLTPHNIPRKCRENWIQSKCDTHTYATALIIANTGSWNTHVAWCDARAFTRREEKPTKKKKTKENSDYATDVFHMAHLTIDNNNEVSHWRLLCRRRLLPIVRLFRHKNKQTFSVVWRFVFFFFTFPHFLCGEVSICSKFSNLQKCV